MKKVSDSVKRYGTQVALNLGLLLVGVLIASVLYFGFTTFIQHTNNGEQIEFSEE
jgi:predicted negative regulator of RcsB-dependent stress response